MINGCNSPELSILSKCYGFWDFVDGSHQGCASIPKYASYLTYEVYFLFFF